MNAEPIRMTLEEAERLESLDPLRKTPLQCRIRFSKDGKPLKTVLAAEFPHLSRQERRLLLRQAHKAEKRAARSTN